MMVFFKKMLVLALLVILSACNSRSTSDAPSDPEVITNTGIFVDSAVINIGYRTATLEGVTDADGKYEYVEGETVTFFIGDLIFPAVTAKGGLTPLDLAATTDVENAQVVNILRILQTLDQDGDPSNGITITDAAKAIATPADFTLPTAEFATLTAVITLILNTHS